MIYIYICIYIPTTTILHNGIDTIIIKKHHGPPMYIMLRLHGSLFGTFQGLLGKFGVGCLIQSNLT